MLVIAVAVDAALALIPTITGLGARIALMVGGIVLNGVATAAYVGARLGPGPRDGLMTGLAARTGWSLRLVRTGIEVTVLAVGWLLGGTVGIGTVLYALAIGPLSQAFLPLFAVRRTAASDLSRSGRRRGRPARSRRAGGVAAGSRSGSCHGRTTISSTSSDSTSPEAITAAIASAVVAQQPDHRGDQPPRRRTGRRPAAPPRCRPPRRAATAPPRARWAARSRR